MMADSKRALESISVLWVVSTIISSCATIFGGPNYHSQVWVNGRPKAEIIYRGEIVGKGVAFISVRRREANKFSIKIREEGCPEQTFDYKSRRLRVGAFLGGLSSVVVDLLTGSIWEPNANENAILKHNYKNFQYVINYSGCPLVSQEVANGDQLTDVLYLKNGAIITGTLMEPDSVFQIKIQSKDGSILVFKLDEVLRVE